MYINQCIFSLDVTIAQSGSSLADKQGKPVNIVNLAKQHNIDRPMQAEIVSSLFSDTSAHDAAKFFDGDGHKGYALNPLKIDSNNSVGEFSPALAFFYANASAFASEDRDLALPLRNLRVDIFKDPANSTAPTDLTGNQMANALIATVFNEAHEWARSTTRACSTALWSFKPAHDQTSTRNPMPLCLSFHRHLH